MSNSSTYSGFYNLPAQFITTTATITPYLVPAQGAYAGLPSPTQIAGNGLFVAVGVDSLAGGMTLDAHMITVRIAGKFTTATASTFQASLYQVPNSIISAGTQGTTGNDNLVVTGVASTSATQSGAYWLEADLVWDSTSQRLGGVVESMTNVKGGNSTYSARAVFTGVALTSVADLNFMPAFQFSAGNAGNFVTISEFTIDRAA